MLFAMSQKALETFERENCLHRTAMGHTVLRPTRYHVEGSDGCFGLYLHGELYDVYESEEKARSMGEDLCREGRKQANESLNRLRSENIIP